MDKRKILFLCVQNTARSQMAEGFLRTLYGDRYEVHSAGVRPPRDTRVNPYAIRVMAEVGVDISRQRAKSWREYGYEFGFDAVISTCSEAERSCPRYPIGKRFTWQFPDPAAAKGTEEEVTQVFRTVRDSIRERIVAAVKNKEI